MRIERLTTSGFDQFLKFNQAIDPNRNDVAERFQFQVLNNPLLEDKARPNILVVYDDAGQIIGQHLHNPFEYCYQGQCRKGYYGYDFFVSANHRNQGIGSALAKASRLNFYPHFGVGVSDASQRIQLALGNRIIGYLFTYIWIANWRSPVKFGLNRIFKTKPQPNTAEENGLFPPATIALRDGQFRRMEQLEQWNYHCPDREMLDFCRSIDFITWRFLSQKNKYHFYLLDESDATTYFVVRTIVAKGLRLLALIDYRMSFEDERRFKLILKATKYLAKLGRHDGIFTMSSHRFFDENFKRNFFLKVGRPIVIITNAMLDLDPRRIKERMAVMATMAESDLDFYFEL